MRLRAFASIVLLFAVVLLLTATNTQAEPGPGSGWWSSLYIQNVSSTSTTITSVALRAFATPTPRLEAFQAFQRRTDPVAPGHAIRLLPQEFQGWLLDGTFAPLPNDFEGTYLVNATQPVSTVVDLTNREIVMYPDGYAYGVRTGRAVGQYQLSPVSWMTSTPFLYFPAVKYATAWNHKMSTLFIQNTNVNSGTAYSLHIEYRCLANPGNLCLSTSPCSSDTPPIRPWAAIAVIPPSSLPSDTVCAARASILEEGGFPSWAGIYTEHFVSESPATLLQTARALTVHDASSTLYAPVFKRNYKDDGAHNRSTGFYVMNTGSSPVNVTGTFYGSTGSGQGCVGGSWSNPTPVPILGWSTVIFPYPDPVPSNCRGSAKFVASSGSIVGMVPESFTTDTQPLVQSATIYAMLPSQIATTKVMFPVYKEKVWEGDWMRGSELTIQNTSSLMTNVQLVFKGIDGTQGTYTTTPQQILGNRSITLSFVSHKPSGFWQPGNAMPATGGSFAVTVSSTTSAPILGVAREASYAFYDNGGWVLCFGQSPDPCPDRADYEGFSIP